jgi:hypothetical protein
LVGVSGHNSARRATRVAIYPRKKLLVNQFLKGGAQRRYFGATLEGTMVDRKQDSLSATGAHRAWIGERNDAPGMSGAVRDLRAWNSRLPPAPVATGNARHSAITRSLANFPNYKSWAEKAKSNWQKDKPE